MKSTALKVSRATRPALVPATALPAAVDAPAEVEMTFTVEADAQLYGDGEPADEQVFARWSVTRRRCRPVTDTDDGSGIAIELTVDTNNGGKAQSFHLFGGNESHWHDLSVAQFRRLVAALNSVAEQLPIVEPTTIRRGR